MKKAVLLVSLSIIIIAVYGSFLLLSQSGAWTAEKEDSPVNSTSPERANQTYNIKIKEFKFTSTWGTPAGVTAAIGFNVTLQNLKNEDLNGLSLEVKMFDVNGSKIQAEAFFYGQGILGHGAQIEPFDGILHAGETRTIRGEIDSDWNTIINTPKPLTTVASVRLGNETLDEWTFTA